MPITGGSVNGLNQNIDKVIANKITRALINY